MKAKTKASKKNYTHDGAFFIIHAPSMDDIYLSLSDQNQWAEVERLMNERRYTIKDTDATYRAINHWTEQGLLDDDRADNSGWRKLSSKDVVWLRILGELRKFGLPLEKLRETHKSLSPSTSIEFEAALALCFQKPATPVFVVVFDDGYAEVATLRSLRITEYMVGYELPYIRINMNALCCQMLGNASLMPPLKMPIELVGSEQEIVEALRGADNSEVRFLVNKGDIEEIQQVKKLEGLQHIATLMQKISHGEVTVKIENGRPVHTTTIKKKRTKK
jgi:DNA-binding transcriptional MerR regulator